MSWLSGYKANKPAAEESREDKRLRLEAERLSRAKNRAAQRKQLQAALEAQAEADRISEEIRGDLDKNFYENLSIKLLIRLSWLLEPKFPSLKDLSSECSTVRKVRVKVAASVTTKPNQI